ncbi:hypothetical protein ACHAW5_005371, partial [Stephanodiscus triporus]
SDFERDFGLTQHRRPHPATPVISAAAADAPRRRGTKQPLSFKVKGGGEEQDSFVRHGGGVFNLEHRREVDVVGSIGRVEGGGGGGGMMSSQSRQPSFPIDDGSRRDGDVDGDGNDGNDNDNNSDDGGGIEGNGGDDDDGDYYNDEDDGPRENNVRPPPPPPPPPPPLPHSDPLATSEVNVQATIDDEFPWRRQGQHRPEGRGRPSARTSRPGITSFSREQQRRRARRPLDRRQVRHPDRGDYLATDFAPHRHRGASPAFRHMSLSSLSPLSYRFAEELECIGLSTALNSLKKGSREWTVIKLKLDVAKDELSCMLEDYNMVRCFAGGGNGDVGNDRHDFAASSDDMGDGSIGVPRPHSPGEEVVDDAGRPVVDAPSSASSSSLSPDRTEARGGRRLQSHAPDVRPSVIRSPRPLHGSSLKGGSRDDEERKNPEDLATITGGVQKFSVEWFAMKSAAKSVAAGVDTRRVSDSGIGVGSRNAAADDYPRANQERQVDLEAAEDLMLSKK